MPNKKFLIVILKNSLKKDEQGRGGEMGGGRGNMTRRSKDKIGFSRQALLHPIPPQIAGPAPEGQKEAPARTPARA